MNFTRRWFFALLGALGLGKVPPSAEITISDQNARDRLLMQVAILRSNPYTYSTGFDDHA